MSTEWYHVQKVAPGVHRLSEQGQINAYLVEGQSYSALIDTGTGLGDLREAIGPLTANPLVVLNTHGHWDHIGANQQFDEIGIHSLDAHWLRTPWVPPSAADFLRRAQDQGQPLPAGIDVQDFRVLPSDPTFHLEQGQVIDLGGRRLQVWHTPGHTPGSVCFLDEDERLLFSGDTVLQGTVRLHFEHSSIDDMQATLSTLSEMAWDINLVLAGHGVTPTDGRLILEVADGLRRTVDGEVPLKKGMTLHGAVRVATFNRFILFLPQHWEPSGK